MYFRIPVFVVDWLLYFPHIWLINVIENPFLATADCHSKASALRLFSSWLCRNALEMPGYIGNGQVRLFSPFSTLVIKSPEQNWARKSLSLLIYHKDIVTTIFSFWSTGRVWVAETVLVSRLSIQKVYWLVVWAHDSAGGAVEEDGKGGKDVRLGTVHYTNPQLLNLHI